ncbi:hypothetical protein [Dichotomicrobium thermohalophilum]|uniref:Uncharacterized protein n=1 Tax=Dichotomicrobium thermohalophilum TaxID=933063 RepID=A0A397Q5R7_9HYPH|nr:hypothetical protein [Dichotomicrobium thermohalophilum]RIA56398.1 hypothetical protein BXY53_1504 [Dichotomicrobium thermohalophilum]
MIWKFVMAAAVAAGTFGAASTYAEARPGGYYDYAPPHCGALIRSAGKKNLVRQFARNSAVFAWKREARYVYGYDYGYWREARGKRIECHREGIFTRCVAKANPCAR